MANDLIRYDLLVQTAFREIFRKVMTDVAAKGLPGDHHFLVTFRTGAPGVKISDRLRQAHPQDMTIVLQHQFWDLAVSETGFTVGLSFQNVPEKLIVPFSSVTGFFDPSVNFGAEFTVETAGSDPSKGDGDKSDGPKINAPKSVARPLALAPVAKPRGSASEPAEVAAAESGAPAVKPEPRPAVPEKRGSKPSDAAEKSDGPTPSKGPKVVSIDAFRKKT